MQTALSPIGHGLDHRALVYDANGTLAPIIHGMGLRCPLHFLNTFDRRGVAGDMAVIDQQFTTTLRLCSLSFTIQEQEDSRHAFTGTSSTPDRSSQGCSARRRSCPSIQVRDGKRNCRGVTVGGPRRLCHRERRHPTQVLWMGFRRLSWSWLWRHGVGAETKAMRHRQRTSVSTCAQRMRRSVVRGYTVA